MLSMISQLLFCFRVSNIKLGQSPSPGPESDAPRGRRGRTTGSAAAAEEERRSVRGGYAAPRASPQQHSLNKC